MKTAIVIVHGIGQQKPYETLDNFTKGFVEELVAQKGEHKIGMSHRLLKLSEDGKHGLPDTKSVIRLSMDNQADQLIDLMEYYWAPHTEKQIRTHEVFKWMEQTLAGTKKFWKESKEIREAYESREAGVSDSKPYYYKMNHLFKNSVWFLRGFRWILSAIPSNVVTNILMKMGNVAGAIINDFAGDVAIYTSLDPKSKFFQIRKTIIDGLLQLLTKLIKGNEYDRVILVGHSLGSVVAYDTLNKINRMANVDRDLRTAAYKISGLVTLGSPLDKIAFFFRQRALEGNYIRDVIVNDIYSFKTKKLAFNDPPYTFGRLKRYFEHTKWLNFYHQNDPVSGFLDFYHTDKQFKCWFESKKENKWGIAHVGYWKDKSMYKQIANTFFSEK